MVDGTITRKQFSPVYVRVGDTLNIIYTDANGEETKLESFSSPEAFKFDEVVVSSNKQFLGMKNVLSFSLGESN